MKLKTAPLRIGIFSLLILGAISVFFVGIKSIFRYNLFRQDLGKLYESYGVELERNQAYKARIEELKLDGYWELQARKRLGLVKKDETVYKFIYQFKSGDR